MSEIARCLAISVDTSLQFGVPEFGVDMRTSRASLIRVSGGPFFRVLEHKGEIVGWISATVGPPAMYSSKQALMLDFYHCTLQGYYAVDALLSAHESMEAAAKAIRGVSLAVTSPCPHTPKAFNRALAKVGWIDHGNILVKIL